MNKPAAFQATYSDWRLIKGRKVVQVVFEIPIEASGLAYDVLGGMPNFGSEVWCAIARLKQPKENEAQPRPSTIPTDEATTGGAQSRRPFTSLPLPQQAALLCNDPVFRAYVKEDWGINCRDSNDAALVMYRRYHITSRSDLGKGIGDDTLFIGDREHFMAWKLVYA